MNNKKLYPEFGDLNDEYAFQAGIQTELIPAKHTKQKTEQRDSQYIILIWSLVVQMHTGLMGPIE